MKAARIDGLADGIFSIVMTLLIIEIRVPEFHDPTNNKELWLALTELAPLCLSYVLSFTLLFTYWRAHCYVIATANSFNVKLTNSNALFLFFVGLIPFTTHLIGKYNYTQLAVFLYGLNIICIGISLYRMKNYISKFNLKEDLQMTAKSIRHTNIRLLVPVYCACIAIGVCFINTRVSMVLFTILIFFNLSKIGADFIDYLIGKGEKNKIQEKTSANS
jgi:uncharacterized membrane protein